MIRRQAPPSTNEALKTVILKQQCSTQEELKDELEKMGVCATQSTISRALRKLGAIRVADDKGQGYYSLSESRPSSIQTTLDQLILDVDHNEAMVVVRTSPGSASLIARHLDYSLTKEILGTIAGDDTVFIAPRRQINIKTLFNEICQLFSLSE